MAKDSNNSAKKKDKKETTAAQSGPSQPNSFYAAVSFINSMGGIQPAIDALEMLKNNVALAGVPPKAKRNPNDIPIPGDPNS